MTEQVNNVFSSIEESTNRSGEARLRTLTLLQSYQNLCQASWPPSGQGAPKSSVKQPGYLQQGHRSAAPPPFPKLNQGERAPLCLEPPAGACSPGSAGHLQLDTCTFILDTRNLAVISMLARKDPKELWFPRPLAPLTNSAPSTSSLVPSPAQ